MDIIFRIVNILSYEELLAINKVIGGRLSQIETSRAMRMGKPPADILALRKIEAIKALRDRWGISLRVAKRVIDVWL